MLLRRLRLSVPDIRAIESGEKALPEAAAGQLDVLQGDIRESEQAYAMCRAICEDRAEWNGLDVDRYQSIVLPADDPREKDRIPPTGCRGGASLPAMWMPDCMGCCGRCCRSGCSASIRRILSRLCRVWRGRSRAGMPAGC